MRFNFPKCYPNMRKLFRDPPGWPLCHPSARRNRLLEVCMCGGAFHGDKMPVTVPADRAAIAAYFKSQRLAIIVPRAITEIGGLTATAAYDFCVVHTAPLLIASHLVSVKEKLDAVAGAFGMDLPFYDVPTNLHEQVAESWRSKEYDKPVCSPEEWAAYKAAAIERFRAAGHDDEYLRARGIL